MRNDRFLLGIVIFIGLLVITALALFAAGGSTQEYMPDGSPEAAVHNYALALTQGDYERAYSYLANVDDKPSLVAFRTFFTQRGDTRNIGLRIGEADILAGEAVVELTLVYGSSGPFDTGFDRPDSAVLVQERDGWKITSMPYPFWEFGWFGERR